MADATDLENELGQLLDQERFPPPEAFSGAARVSDGALHAAPGEDAPAWWLEQTKGVLDWKVEPTVSLDSSKAPFYEWFADGELNVSHNCLDRHVEAGRGEKVAFHWRGEEGEERDVTYTELLADTQRIANALKARGIGKGDVVGIFLPMIPEAAAAMLACARIGAVHNVVFGGFSPGSVRERMEVSEAKALITADQARRKGKTAPIKAALDEVLSEDPLPKLETIFVVRHVGEETPMEQGRDHWLDEAMASAPAECPAEPLPAEHPLFILYSSGSTAKPKGIQHTTGGYLTQVAWTHREVFDLKDDDVYFCSADIGWITGHSYIVYGPLANGATSVMYEGAPDYPHKGIWWELCERYGVSLFYTAPTAIRACMKWGSEHPAEHDLSKLRLLGTVGEPINPKAWLWYHKVIGQRALPDRRHLVADRDRRDHGHDAPGRAGREAGRRRARRSRASPCACSTTRARRSRTASRACSRSPTRGPRCSARSTRTLTATWRPTGRSSVPGPTSSATPRAWTTRATSR